MRYVYAAIIALFTTVGHCYDVLIPQNYGQTIVSNNVPVISHIMVYHTPYFTVTVPVQINNIIIAQPPQQTIYWGYPYQLVPINNYYWYHRSKLFRY